MSMHQGLDLSRFKKVSSDNKSTTLVHAKGHEIKIAHSGLTPKMREQLNGLPVHLAEGGDVKKEDDDPSAYVEPKKEDTSDPSGAPQEPAPQPQPQVEEVAPEPAPGSMPPGDPAAVTNQPAPETAAQPVPSTPTPQVLDQEHANFDQDVSMGHIKPETYQSLYAKQDTLGKIGTLFGLLVSGAGSGLSHQPNAVMDMMNKEIERDLEAQKSSNINNQNWYKMSLQHDLQQFGQIPEMQARTQHDKVSAYGDTVRADLERYKLKSLDPHADLSASDAARNYMMSGVSGYLQQNVINKIPPGPTRVQAQTTLNDTVIPAIKAETSKNNVKRAANLAAGQAKKNSSGINDAKLLAMQNRGKLGEGIGIPGRGIASEDLGATDRESKLVKSNRAAMYAYVDSFNKLNKLAVAGKLNPELLNAEKAQIEGMMARQSSTEEAKKQTEAMFPSIKDWGAARAEKFDKAMEHFKTIEASTSTLDKYPGIKDPFPTIPNPVKEAKNQGLDSGSKIKDGMQSTSKSGKPIIYKNGKWQYK